MVFDRNTYFIDEASKSCPPIHPTYYFYSPLTQYCNFPKALFRMSYRLRVYSYKWWFDGWMYSWSILSMLSQCSLYADFVHPFCLQKHLSYTQRHELQLRFCYLKAYENENYKHCKQMKAIASHRMLTLGIKVTDLKRIINWLKSGTWEMSDFVTIVTTTLGDRNTGQSGQWITYFIYYQNNIFIYIVYSLLSIQTIFDVFFSISSTWAFNLIQLSITQTFFSKLNIS